MNNDNIKNHTSLSKYVDSLQALGHYAFTRLSFLKHASLSKESFMVAAHRLEQKGRILKPVRGFYAIVPLEYSRSGLPVNWYVDDLMQFLNLRYYVSLLSAAVVYGAGHQQPQTFQVIAEKSHSETSRGAQRIQFYAATNITKRFYQTRNTQTGIYKVATPEQTAVDLVRYYKHAGYFNNVATILSELSDQLDADQLMECAQNEGIATAQRLGYLLDFVERDSLTKKLSLWVKSRVTKYVPLRPDLKDPAIERSQKWKLNINELVETDLDT